MLRFFTAALLLLSLSSCESLKDDDKVVITVHSQGTDMDSPKTIFRRPVGGRNTIFKILPEFSTKSVAAFHPFPADDGTFGVALKLDFKGTQALDIVTRMRQGEVLISMVNGTVVDYVVINKPVHDGLFTIWRGFPEELIASMEEKYPRIKDLKSSSDFLEMTPSTTKEKKNARKRAEQDLKDTATEEKRKASAEFEPEAPNGEIVPLSEVLKSSR